MHASVLTTTSFALWLSRDRYEVGRFFGAVERLKRAAEEQNGKEAQKAFAAMSVAYDRYLKVSAAAMGRTLLSALLLGLPGFRGGVRSR